jgi:hypothetical protein
MAFKKGTSGNKSGRPRGIPDKRHQLRLALESRATELLDSAIGMALAGDSSVMKTLLDRLIAPARPEPVPLKLSGDLSGQAQQVLQAMAGGQLAPDEARQVLNGLAAVAKITEIDTITKRLEVLEARLLEDKKL